MSVKHFLPVTYLKPAESGDSLRDTMMTICVLHAMTAEVVDALHPARRREHADFYAKLPTPVSAMKALCEMNA